VIVTLEADPTGTQRGNAATLILTDRIRGVFLYRSDRGALPNRVAATLPAGGRYDVLVLEQPIFKGRRRSRGAYCLTLESSDGARLVPTLWVESPQYRPRRRIRANVVWGDGVALLPFPANWSEDPLRASRERQQGNTVPLPGLRAGRPPPPRAAPLRPR